MCEVKEDKRVYRENEMDDDTIPFHLVTVDFNTCLNESSFGKLYPGQYKDQQVMIKAVENDGENPIKEDISIVKSLDSRFLLNDFGYTETGGSRYLILEWCEGSLDQYIKGKLEHIPIDSIHEKVLLAQITAGLSHIHKNRMIHKSINPANIFLWRSDSGSRILAKIARFGYTTTNGEKENIRPTSSGWIAPEGLEKNGVSPLNLSSDIFCLGLVYFYVLTKGQHPFGSNKFQRDKWMNFGIPNLKAISGQWEALDLVSRMIHKDPDNRPNVFVLLFHPFFTNFSQQTRGYLGVTIHYIEENMNQSQWKIWMDSFKKDHLTEWINVLKPKDKQLDKVPERDRKSEHYLQSNFDKERIVRQTLNEEHNAMILELRCKSLPWNTYSVLNQLFRFSRAFPYYVWSVLCNTFQQENLLQFQYLDFIVEMIYQCKTTGHIEQSKLDFTGLNDPSILHFINVGTVGNCQEVVNLIIENDLISNGKMNHLETTLHYAAAFSTPGFIEFLLSKKIRFRASNAQRISPVHLAAAFSSTAVLDILLQNRFHLVDVDSNGQTVLHYAARFSTPEMVNFLLAKDTQLDLSDLDGRTIAHCAAQRPSNYAARTSSQQMVEFLLKKGVRLKALTKNGQTVLHCAASGASIEMIHFLLKKGLNLNQMDNNGKTVIHYAARYSSIPMLEFLLSKGLKLSVLTKDGRTPLHYAAQGSSTEMIDFLISKGLNLNDVSHDGWTVLHHAAMSSTTEMVEFLLQKGMKCNLLTRDGNTVLHCAAQGSSIEMVDFLLQKGLKINDVDNEGWTVLHHAACCSSVAMVDFLLQKGMNLDVVTKDGKTVLHCALQGSSSEIVKYLFTLGMKLDDNDHYLK